ncbi:hypothetical protein T484DRAFT_1824750 [Baffinella frigidus]|nr:hypothetical protein T484DRAFT_1824750 [Cryptophyta sp. CCMP2293]
MGSGASTERPLASGKQVLEAARSASSGTKDLKLTGMRLTALPNELAVQAALLRGVDLSWNNLEAFPEALFLLVSMETLDLSHNRLAQVWP